MTGSFRLVSDGSVFGVQLCTEVTENVVASETWDCHPLQLWSCNTIRGSDIDPMSGLSIAYAKITCDVGGPFPKHFLSFIELWHT